MLQCEILLSYFILALNNTATILWRYSNCLGIAAISTFNLFHFNIALILPRYHAAILRGCFSDLDTGTLMKYRSSRAVKYVLCKVSKGGCE